MFLTNLFISAAQAQDNATGATAPMSDPNSIFMNIAPILIIFVIFYFLVIRPQSKKIKAHQAVMSQLKKGDQIVTGGGFLGTVVTVADDIITVDLGNGQIVRALKHTLSGLQTANTPNGPVTQDNQPATVKTKTPKSSL